MKLEIRHYYSADIDDLHNWTPSIVDEVCFHLEFEICQQGDKGANVFQVTVATPEGLRWFAEKYKSPFPNRGVLVFDSYSWNSLVDRIEDIVAQCTRDSWEDSIDCLRLYFMWEYENLRIEE